MASAIYFMAHCLALNQDVQKKLREEVDEMNRSLKGLMPSYEDLQKMNYLDMVVSETLRVHPPVPILDRRCTKETTFENNDGTKVKIEPGDVVFIPSIIIHMDPNLWPSPEKFLPERFSHGNRDNIKPFSYLPFGTGPRNCIGSRFALMAVKSVFFNILSNFTIEKCSRTENPVQLLPDINLIRPKNGIWLALKPRSK